MDMKHPKIIVAGIGPGNESDITPAVISALQESDVVVGYKYYFQFVIPYLHPSTTCIDTGMKRERARAEQAFELAARQDARNKRYTSPRWEISIPKRWICLQSY